VKAFIGSVLALGLPLAGCDSKATVPVPIPETSPVVNETLSADDFHYGSYLQGAILFDMSSTNTGDDYTIRVVTPPGYEKSGKSHPILLVMDGSLLFSTAAESAGLQASIGETRPVIVVGVSSKGSMQYHNTRRQRDYSGGTAVTKMLTSKEITPADGGLWPLYNRLKEAGIPVEDGFGGATEYLSFLTDELLPRLEADYRVDENEIGLMGHSLGGALIAHALLTKDTPFTKFIAGTFGIDWYTPEEMEAMQTQYQSTPAPHRVDIFYGYGGVEVADFPGAIEKSVTFLEALQATDPNYVDSILTWNFEREQHGSVVAAVIASGIHHLWGTGLSYEEAAKIRNNDEWK
jgi:predicted alpha/beta superfamily hydrolase